ncbi:hypothetical protein ACFCZQ_09645 [Streptomyces virginiae]
MSSCPGTPPGRGRRGTDTTGGRTFFAFGLACGTPTDERGRFGFADDDLFRSTRTRVRGPSSCCTGRVLCRARAAGFSCVGSAATAAGTETAADAVSEGSADNGTPRSCTAWFETDAGADVGAAAAPDRARGGLPSVGATETHPDAANRTAISKGRVRRRIRPLWRTQATKIARHALRRAVPKRSTAVLPR